MKKFEEPAPERSLLKGMLAGLVGGLAATAVKAAAEKFYESRLHQEIKPHTALGARLPEGVGHFLTAGEDLAMADSIHWGIGAAAGAVYGGVAEYVPAATAKDGASYGLALSTIAQRLSGEPEKNAIERTTGMAAHVVYGLVTETVRRFVRKRLG
jgi:putative membrane protein